MAILNTSHALLYTLYDSHSHLLLLSFHGAANEDHNSHLLVLVLTMLQSQLHDMHTYMNIWYVVCMHVYSMWCGSG